MNLIDTEYQDLLCYILGNGVEKETRNGKTLSIFGWQIRHNMKDGFPLLTTKKMHWKSIVTELLWFLRGDTNIKYLVDNDCHIWDGDCYRAYCNTYPDVEKTFQYEGSNIEVRKMTKDEFIEQIKTDDEFAKQWGELGPIYGKQWRDWTYLTSQQKEDIDGIDEEICGADIWDGIRHYRTFDQIANLISELKTNPDSRRLMVNAWNVGELDQMVLPPCHFSWQCYSHEQDGKRYLSLAWNQRSVDVGLGLPFNIASYGLLLEIIAKEVNMIPYELIGNLGDCHIYNNHIDGIKEQIGREPFELPTLKFSEWYANANQEKQSAVVFNDWIESLKPEDFAIENYQSHPAIKLPLSN
jgi:thymidylate synthase